MAQPKSRGGSKRRSSRAQKGPEPADDRAANAEPDPDAQDHDPDEEGADVPDDLVGTAAAGVIDLDPDASTETTEPVDDDGVERDPDAEDLIKPAKRERGGSLAKRDPLAAYMQETKRYPLLTPEEEHALAVRLVEHGDSAAARRMIEANLRLVVKIAYEYRRAHKNLLDLVQEGNIGLMQAVRKFDPYRGVKLSSYAAFWIRAYILKFILNNWRLVKIGTTQAQRKLFFNLRKEKEKLEQLGFAPEHRLLAERLDVTEAEVAEMERRLEGADMSLDAPLGREDPGGATRLDVMPSSEVTRPDLQVETSEFRGLLKEKLEHFASELTGRDEVLRLYREAVRLGYRFYSYGDAMLIL